MDELVTLLELNNYLVVFSLFGLGLATIIATTFFRSKIVSKILHAISIGFFVLAMLVILFMGILNTLYFGFGYGENEIQFSTQQKNILWLTDYILMGDGDGGIPTEEYRLHGFNLDNGQKLFRHLTHDYFDVIGADGETIWINQSNQTKALDLNTAETKLTIDEPTLTKLHPELSQKIYQYKFDPETQKVNVTTKDGSNLSINPLGKDPNPTKPSDLPLEIADTRISNNYRNILSLTDENKKHLVNSQGNILDPEIFFLNGRFLTYDQENQRVFIASAVSLDQEDFIINCLSLKGDLLWQKSSLELTKNITLNPDHKSTLALVYNSHLIINIGNMLYSLNSSNGELTWASRI